MLQTHFQKIIARITGIHARQHPVDKPLTTLYTPLLSRNSLTVCPCVSNIASMLRSNHRKSSVITRSSKVQHRWLTNRKPSVFACVFAGWCAIMFACGSRNVSMRVLVDARSRITTMWLPVFGALLLACRACIWYAYCTLVDI